MEKHKWQSSFLKERVLDETSIMLANTVRMLPPLFLAELQGGGRESEAQVHSGP